jgi:hypothetical protein
VIDTTMTLPAAVPGAHTIDVQGNTPTGTGIHKRVRVHYDGRPTGGSSYSTYLCCFTPSNAADGTSTEQVDIIYHGDKGVQATVAGHAVLVGTARLLGDVGIDTTALDPLAQELAAAGKTPVLVAVDGQPAGVLAPPPAATWPVPRCCSAPPAARRRSTLIPTGTPADHPPHRLTPPAGHHPTARHDITAVPDRSTFCAVAPS